MKSSDSNQQRLGLWIRLNLWWLPIGLALIAVFIAPSIAAQVWCIRVAAILTVILLLRALKRDGRIVFLSGFITLLVIEFAIRGVEWYGQVTYPGESATRPIYIHDALRGWKMKPDTEVWFSNREHLIRTKIRTNSLGLRSPSISLQKPDGVQRILMIGNSSLAGFEVAQSRTIAAWLDQILNRGLATKRFEVINGGVRGYGTDQSYLYLLHEGLRLDPDFIIYIFTANDLEDNLTIHDPNRMFGKSVFILDSNNLPVLTGVPVPPRLYPEDRLLTVFNRSLQTQSSTRPMADTALLPVPDRVPQSSTMVEALKDDCARSALYRFMRTVLRTNRQVEQLLVQVHLLEAWQSRIDSTSIKQAGIFYSDSAVDFKYRIFEQLVVRMQHCADSMGVPFALFEMTNGYGSMPVQPTRVGALCAHHSVDYINAFPEFHTRSRGTLKYRFKNDGHWNNAGHALAATVIATHLNNPAYQFRLAKPVRN